jgi:hypothetical protein
LAIGGGTFGKGDGPSFIGGEELPANGSRAVDKPAAQPPAAAPAIPAPAAPPEAERVADRPVV